MELSPDDIKRITLLIAENLGPEASQNDLIDLTRKVIEKLSQAEAETSAIQLTKREKSIGAPSNQRLILNAFGLDKGNLVGAIKSYAAGKAIRIVEISSVPIAEFRSVIFILDSSDYRADINQVKFDLDRVCIENGSKAIIQDSGYYRSF